MYFQFRFTEIHSASISSKCKIYSLFSIVQCYIISFGIRIYSLAVLWLRDALCVCVCECECECESVCLSVCCVCVRVCVWCVCVCVCVCLCVSVCLSACLSEKATKLVLYHHTCTCVEVVVDFIACDFFLLCSLPFLIVVHYARDWSCIATIQADSTRWCCYKCMYMNNRSLRLGKAKQLRPKTTPFFPKRKRRAASGGI